MARAPLTVDLAERLEERRAEIEQAMLARVQTVVNPRRIADPGYAVGLREAVASAVGCVIAEVESGGRSGLPTPEPLLSQARAAARNGVSLDTVVRRYSAGYFLLSNLLIAEAQRAALPAEQLERSLRAMTALFDRLVAEVSGEYASAAEGGRSTVAGRRAGQVRALLEGEASESDRLPYRLDAWHLGIVADGAGAVPALRDIAVATDRSLLHVPAGGEETWAWLGGRDPLSSREVKGLVEWALPAEIAFGLGEPASGLEGWRLSHRQAGAAMAVVRRSRQRVARYASVALLASALGDDLLSESLREIYLAPLETGPDGGALLRSTLEAYFQAERNITSAAAALGVTRQTVRNRLRLIEERIGRPLATSAAEIETCVRIEGLVKR